MAPRPPVMTATLPSSRGVGSKLMGCPRGMVEGDRSSCSWNGRARELHLAGLQHEVVLQGGVAAALLGFEAADQLARDAEDRVAFEVLVVVREDLRDEHLVARLADHEVQV